MLPFSSVMLGVFLQLRGSPGAAKKCNSSCTQQERGDKESLISTPSQLSKPCSKFKLIFSSQLQVSFLLFIQLLLAFMLYKLL